MDFKVKRPKMEYFGELENGTFFLYNDEIYFKEKEIYESKLNQYNNHPLIINFNNTKDEVAALLQQIEQILQ